MSFNKLEWPGLWLYLGLLANGVLPSEKEEDYEEYPLDYGVFLPRRDCSIGGWFMIDIGLCFSWLLVRSC